MLSDFVVRPCMHIYSIIVRDQANDCYIICKFYNGGTPVFRV